MTLPWGVAWKSESLLDSGADLVSRMVSTFRSALRTDDLEQQYCLSIGSLAGGKARGLTWAALWHGGVSVMTGMKGLRFRVKSSTPCLQACSFLPSDRLKCLFSLFLKPFWKKIQKQIRPHGQIWWSESDCWTHHKKETENRTYCDVGLHFYHHPLNFSCSVRGN